MAHSLFELPASWDVKPLSEITSDKIVYGIVQAGPHVDDGIPYIKSTDIVNGICLAQLSRTAKAIHDKYRRSAVEPGDVVISLRSNIGETAIVPGEVMIANLTQGTARIRVKCCHLAEFISYQISSPMVMRSILAASKGSTFKEISLEDLRKIKIPFPPLSEQKKIAQILSAWDKSIETVDKLIENSQKQKKWLMQNLLTGKKRLPGFKDEWKRVSFKSLFFEKKKIRCGDQNAPKLSVTKDGIVLQCKYFLKSVTSEDTSDYLVIKRGEIAMSGLNFWMGSIDMLVKHSMGIISPAYKIYTVNNDLISSGFARHFVRSDLMKKCLVEASVVGASIVRRNLDKDQLYCHAFKVPSLNEQREIECILDCADNLIERYKASLVKLRHEKSILMQELLTGKLRVKIDASDTAVA